MGPVVTHVPARPLALGIAILAVTAGVYAWSGAPSASGSPGGPARTITLGVPALPPSDGAGNPPASSFDWQGVAFTLAPYWFGETWSVGGVVVEPNGLSFGFLLWNHTGQVGPFITDQWVSPDGVVSVTWNREAPSTLALTVTVAHPLPPVLFEGVPVAVNDGGNASTNFTHAHFFGLDAELAVVSWDSPGGPAFTGSVLLGNGTTVDFSFASNEVTADAIPAISAAAPAGTHWFSWKVPGVPGGFSWDGDWEATLYWSG